VASVFQPWPLSKATAAGSTPKIAALELKTASLSIIAIVQPKENTEQGQTAAEIWEKMEIEVPLGWEKYTRYINRRASMLWLKYTPEFTLAFDQTPWLQNLINDKFYGKLGTRSTKLQAYKEVNPEMLFRKKQTGFEKIKDLTNEFEQFLHNKYNGFHCRAEVIVETHLAEH
jgi:hypothetical protein